MSDSLIRFDIFIPTRALNPHRKEFNTAIPSHASEVRSSVMQALHLQRSRLILNSEDGVPTVLVAYFLLKTVGCAIIGGVLPGTCHLNHTRHGAAANNNNEA